MISKKVFSADGTTTRFLSDFLIRSEQFARPYVYIYDEALAGDGSEDVLQDGTTLQSNWSYPDNLWRRGTDSAASNDLTTTDKWQVVDNSILYYIAPLSGTRVWVEVATTAEEFGDTLTQPSYQNIKEAEWEGTAAKMTADSYATQPEDEFVIEYTSNKDGTYTGTPTTEYSALHWANKSDESAASINLPDISTGTEHELLEVNSTLTGYNLVENIGRISVADRTELLTKTGTREGEVILQRDIGLLYAWTTTQGVDNGGTILNVATGSWLAQYSGAVSVKWFGAKGEGITDDTSALQLAFDTSYTDIYIPMGNYVITDSIQDGTPSLTTSTSNRRIICDGTITANSIVLNAIKNTGDDCEISMNIDGNSYIAVGIISEGDRSNIHHCNIKDLYTETYQVLGISVSGGKSCIIKNNILTNFNSVGTIGNGYCRGIHWAQTADQTEYSLIEDNAITDMLGKEADSITIISSNGLGVYYDANVTIKGNIVNEFSRRGVKIQANKTKVLSNSFTNNTTGWANPLTVIDFVQGDNHVATNNLIDACIEFSGISSYAVAPESFDNFIIENNEIFNRQLSLKGSITMITRGNRVTINNNTIEGGEGVHLTISALNGISIKGNTIEGETSSNAVISLGSGGSDIIVSDNSFRGGARAVFIDTSSQTILINNTVFSDTPMFKDTAGNTESYISGNILLGTAAFYSDGDSRYNKFGGNVSIGVNTMYFQQPLFVPSTSTPVTFLTGMHITQGQIVYRANPAAGSKIGWVATDSGLAEAVTWKEFGAIDS